MSIWIKVNNLSLDVSKTNYMIFGEKYTDSVCNIKIDGVVVDRVHGTTFLGVLVDDELTLNNHITSVCKNIYKNILIFLLNFVFWVIVTFCVYFLVIKVFIRIYVFVKIIYSFKLS